MPHSNLPSHHYATYETTFSNLRSNSKYCQLLFLHTLQGHLCPISFAMDISLIRYFKPLDFHSTSDSSFLFFCCAFHRLHVRTLSYKSCHFSVVISITTADLLSLPPAMRRHQDQIMCRPYNMISNPCLNIDMADHSEVDGKEKEKLSVCK